MSDELIYKPTKSKGSTGSGGTISLANKVEQVEQDSKENLKQILITRDEIKNLGSNLKQEINEIKKDNIGILGFFTALITFLFSSVEILEGESTFLGRFFILFGLGFTIIGFMWLLNQIIKLYYPTNVEKSIKAEVNQVLINVFNILLATLGIILTIGGIFFIFFVYS